MDNNILVIFVKLHPRTLQIIFHFFSSYCYFHSIYYLLISFYLESNDKDFSTYAYSTELEFYNNGCLRFLE